MNKIIRWFNDFGRGYIRLRFCERCGRLTRKNHWSKNDQIKYDGPKCTHGCITGKQKVVYGHIWLCYDCFYGKLLGLQ